ncbi:DoxX family protein [Bacillus sp. CGMCC 1.16607]|uniref:DoxX family protein n=1 Tax=Bacillus sp. CGMCC 1.16607 TaxID=3351842 RepID=UPI003632CE5F
MEKFGRILIGLVFTYMGVYKILNWGATADWMAMKGLPLIPALLVVAILVEVVGGVMLVFGKKLKIVATVLALFLLPTNVIFHNFWAMPAEQAASEFLSFLQNIAIIGGLLAVAIKKELNHLTKQSTSF